VAVKNERQETDYVNVAVITGGSSRVGFRIAVEFVAQGATVLITGRNQETGWVSGAIGLRELGDPRGRKADRQVVTVDLTTAFGKHISCALWLG